MLAAGCEAGCVPRVRTGYSFRTAVGKLEDVLARVQECGYCATAPITDRASTFGWVKWAKLAKEAGIKPVFGVELAVTDSLQAKKPIVDHWTFVAQSSVQPINHLVGMATEQFRYEPLLTYEQAQEMKGVWRIIGHRAQIGLTVPDDETFISLGPSTAKGYIRDALGMGHQPVMVSDNKYVLPDDQGFYEVTCGRDASSQNYDQHIQTGLEWQESVRKTGIDAKILKRAVENVELVLNSSTAELVKAELVKPEKDLSLREMCIKGAASIGVDLKDPEYKDRMDRELALIADKGYEDYFYIVADMCKFARARMIVGPARGSSGGSLVCYLLNITTIDPIPHGLIFERFIDVNRDDIPDIDIDFSDQHRNLVFEYMNKKYGADRVARLGTVAMFRPRSALDAVGTALRVPRWKCDAVAESLIERSTGDSRALQTLADTMMTMPAGKDLLEEHPEMKIAGRMEGHPRHHSQHAAGIVVASHPITDYVAVDKRTGATMCDKKDAEALNLLKIDALGLRQLSVFEDCLEMAQLSKGDLHDIAMDDPKAFKVLNDGHFSGIFQFNGMALQSITKQFTVTSFNDIVSVTALGRPGPLSSGGAHEWIRRRNNINAITYFHPVFEPYLADTMGIVLYQEQVMEIGRNIGNLDWGQVTALRKAMSQSLGKEYFDQFGDPWKRGAIAKGVRPEDADKVWDDLCAYGSWSFNKSHSVAYGMISYQCCWLKAHYPFEFAAATLTHEVDPTRQIQLLREMDAEGYKYIPVDAEQSTNKWAVGSRDGIRILVGPLHNVKGIGPKTVEAVLNARRRGERKIPEKARKLLLNPVTDIDSLWPIRDAFQRILPDPAERQIFTPPTPISSIQIQADDYDVVVFCTLSKINPRDENEAVMVARRGYEIKDNLTSSLNLQLTDDTDTIFGKIDRFRYPRMGKEIVERGRTGKALYAVKGRVRGGSTFRMVLIQSIRYVGDAG
jgi:DNA polymerase III alpha subunit